MRLTFYALIGYLCGSILFAYYLPLWLKGIDITKGTKDKNPGVSNCVAKAGWVIGIAALVFDLLKGGLPVFLARRTLDSGRWTFALVMAAPVLGHLFPIFRKFSGGKGIAVSFGVMLGLLPVFRPLVLLVLLYLFFLLVVRVHPNRLLSIITFTAFGLLSIVIVRQGSLALGCVLISALVAIRHVFSREESVDGKTAKDNTAGELPQNEENNPKFVN